MNARIKLLPLVATMAMTMFGTMVCHAEASAKAPVHDECCPSQKDDENKVHTVVENLPQFPGGMPAMADYLRKEIRYPKKCAEQKIEGRSIITFVVEKNGKISKVKVLRSAGNKKLDKEAKRAVKSMPLWHPGTHKGKVVKVQMTLPILFKLSKQ